MSELPADLVARKGCTRREAGLLRAALLLGGGELPLRVIDDEARANLEPHVESMKKLDDDERAALVEAWEVPTDFASMVAVTDIDEHARRLTPRWRQALRDAVDREAVGVAFGDEKVASVVRSLALEGAPRKVVAEPDVDSPLAPLADLSAPELDDWFMSYGAALLAALEEDLGRRKIARIGRAVSEDQRQLMTRVLRDGVSVSEELRARIRELFIALAEGADPVSQQIRQMGLYFLALAAGQRWASEVEVIAARLEPQTADALRRFHSAIRRSTRAHLEVESRDLLETLAKT